MLVWWRDRKGRRQQGPACFTPRIECLEDRTLLNAGILDPTFGNGGLVTTPFNYTDMNSLAVQPNGQIVVAGVGTNPNVFNVARFNPNGTLDPTFGVNGLVALASFAPGSVDKATALALQTNGDIVVGGDTTAGGGGSQSNFGVVRLTSTGGLDTSFGNNGHVIIDFYGGNDFLSGIAIDSLGRIVCAGLSSGNFALARILPDGMQDSDFNADGKIFFNFATTFTGGFANGSVDGINAVAIQPGTNQIFVAGFTNTHPNGMGLATVNSFALAEFNAIDGTLDTAFGKFGLVDMNFLGADDGNTVLDGGDVAHSLTFMPNGDIAVGGVAEFGGNDRTQNFGLAMFGSGGTLDKTYNADGLVATNFSTNFGSGSLGNGPVTSIAYSIALQPDNKLVLGGVTNRNGNNNFALARYNTDGTLDQGFGLHGEVVTAFTPSSLDQATNLVLQPNGLVLAAGTSNQGSGPVFAMARYSGIEAGDLQFSATAYTAAENSGSAVITVTRINGSDNTVTVNYSTSNGTAVAGTDYTAASGTLTFAPGVASQTFSVPLLNNGVFSALNKTVNLTLSSPTGGGQLGIPDMATLTITNSNTPSGIEFSSATYNVAESAGAIVLTVTRNTSGGTVSVNYATSNGTGVAGTDYNAASGTVTFAAGQTTQTITIGILDNGVFQTTNNSFTVTLSNPTGGAVLGSPITATVTIINSNGTPNERWIAQAYLDLLHRPVDSTGLAVWTAALNAGSTRTQVALAIESSQEYRVIEVNNLYQQYLHRPADAGGLATFTAALANGSTVEQVAAALVGSQEFFQNQGAGTTNGFLNALYLDALGRNIDPTGLSVFNQLLANGATHSQVAAVLFSSTEYAQDLVFGWYQEFLHRQGDQAGVNMFVNLLHPTTGPTQPIFITDPTASGVPLRDEQVIAMFVGSQEYFNDATAG